MKIFNILSGLGKEQETDIETAIKKYIEFSNIPKKKIDENDEEVDLTPEEKGHYKKCFEEAEYGLKQICKKLETEDVDSVIEYLDTFSRLYENDKENRRFIKKALLTKSSINLVRKWRNEDPNRLYESISKMEEIIPLGNNSYFTFDAFSSIYGWTIGNEKDKSIFVPLSNEIIISTIKTFTEHEDNRRLAKWVIEIMAYNKKNLCIPNDIAKFDSEKKLLQMKLSSLIKEDEKMKSLIIKELFEAGLLFDLAIQSKEAQRVKCLEEEIKKNEEEYIAETERKEKSFQERAARQFQKINELNARNEMLISDKDKFERLEKQYERLGQALTETKIRLAAEIENNEHISNDALAIIQEKDNQIDSLKRDVYLTKMDLIEAKDALEAIKVDITLKNNEIQKLKESVGSKDSDATENLLKSLVSNLNNQIFYLSMFCQILSEDNGYLDDMNIDMFKDVLVQVDAALAEIGLKKLGTLDESVEYDSAVHNPVSESISNGEKVKVTGFGWEINGEVFIKVPVEKEV